MNANDVFFSLHAVLLCLVYVSQATVYEVCVCHFIYLQTFCFKTLKAEEQNNLM